MSGRSHNIDNFLAQAGWAGARRTPLAGDASFRRYERVFLNGNKAVLMDAPPDKEDVKPFMRAAEFLLVSGMSPPRILATDIAQGFLLLEDLGDALYSSVLRAQPDKEEDLYTAATDALIALYQQASKADYTHFLQYDESMLMRECSLFSEWFLPLAVKNNHLTEAVSDYTAIWKQLLAQQPAIRPVMVLRDYHADNLLWLPDRVGVKRVGLLDFQDAVIGSPAYDMVSFLEDARRDVQPLTVKKIADYYLERTSIAKNDFMTSYALLGAQRNCKIIGIFIRLALRDGKQQYMSYLPRVWGHLENDLQHPVLKPLKVWMDKVVSKELRHVSSIKVPNTMVAG